MNLSRRKFLSGAAAGMAIMAMPLPCLQRGLDILYPDSGTSVVLFRGQWMGIVIREAEEMSGLTPEMLGVR